ncbi:10392_t:CDS:1, partial [Funneliformis geosporum]
KFSILKVTSEWSDRERSIAKTSQFVNEKQLQLRTKCNQFVTSTENYDE